MKKLIISTIAAILFCVSCKKEDNNVVDNKPVQSFAGINLGNQSAVNYSCFLTLDSCRVYSLASAKANQGIIDLIFLHNDPDNLAMFVTPASIASAITYTPVIYSNLTNGITTWSTKNSMQLGITDISVADFNGINTNGALNSAYENDPHVTIGWEIDITAGKVYKFTSNRTGKRGLIKVNGLSGNYASAGGINMDIKMIN